MNWLDLLLLVVLAYSIASSFRKGLTREIVRLGSVVLALVLGCWFYGSAGALVERYVGSRTAANCVGFFLVFCGVLLAGTLVSFVIGKFLKVTGLSFFDHAFGAVFGAARGVLIAVAVVMAAMAFAPGGDAPAAVVNSRLAPYVAQASRAFAAMAPHELKEGFRKSYAEVKADWESAARSGIHDGGSGTEKHEKRI